jgi:hypothetical protein
VSGYFWKGVLFSLCLLAGNTIAAPATRSTDKYERKVPYTGPKLASPIIMCKASQLAIAGFWRNLGDATVHEGARIEQETKPTYWRVSIIEQRGTAQVIRFNANFETLESPVIFTAEPTPGGGLLLVRKDRESGTSPETISIDPDNSSFVYSSQHANLMHNRANIWYGACAAYE